MKQEDLMRRNVGPHERALLVEVLLLKLPVLHEIDPSDVPVQVQRRRDLGVKVMIMISSNFHQFLEKKWRFS
jgi:hypothetical protein